jgi:hypothetical protein
MDDEEQKRTDDALRAAAVGYAVLDAAEENPAMRAWLDRFLDAAMTEPHDRELFGLPKTFRPGNTGALFGLPPWPGN